MAEQKQTGPAVVNFPFPVGGMVLAGRYGSQPKNTTASATNVRPMDTFSRRMRGGSRPGMEKAFTGQIGSGYPVQFLVSVATTDDVGSLTRTLIACSHGQMYRNAASAMESFGVGVLGTETADAITTEAGAEIWLGGMSMNTSLASLQACERAEKIYIANVGAIQLSGADGTVTTGVLTATGVTDWTAYGIGFPSAVQITGTSGDVVTGTYEFVSVAEAGLTIDDGAATTGNCTYLIQYGPAVFDLSTGDTSILLPTAGQVPLGCPLICLYRDRLVLAGPDHVWYMSRQGDPTDWDYGADSTDPQLPVAGTLSTAGTPGTPIRALIPCSDDYLIFGCEDQLWVLAGDPAYGGQLDAISRRIGIVGPSAWCRLPDASVLVLSRDGLYVIAGGADSYPRPLSRIVLPDSLIDVDAEANVVVMAYDTQYGGVHLAITPIDGTTGEHWWIQWPQGGSKDEAPSFWQVELDDDQQPNAMLAFASEASEDYEVMLGTRDGYVRKYVDTATDDDGTAFTSTVRIGPVRLGGDDYHDGMLEELFGTLDQESDSVYWRLYAEDTDQEAVESTSVVARGEWTAGRNRPKSPRATCGAACIDLFSSGRWAMENIVATVLPRGRQRV